MITPYQSFTTASQNTSRGQRLAQMLQMQGQSQQISNNAGAQSDMQYSPPQNAANINGNSRQQGQLFGFRRTMPKSPGMMTPQGGQDRSSYDGE
jgi:hypothetical protein